MPGALAVAALMVLAAVFLARAPLAWGAVAVAGALFLVVLAVRPVVGLAAVAFAIPFGALRPLAAGMNAVDLLAALAVAAWLAAGVARRRITFRRPALALPVLGLLWVLGLSLTQAGSWRDGIAEWLKWAEFAAVYLVASQTLGGKATAWTLAALFAAGLVEVGIGAYQFVRQVGPEAFILMGRFMRAFGTFNQPNPYAGYLGYLTPVAASLAIAGLRRWWSERRRRDLALGLAGTLCATAFAAGIGMSWSRGGWLGLASALVVVGGMAALCTPHNRRAGALTAAAMVLVLSAVVLAGAGRLPASITARLGDLGGLTTTADPARTEITNENFAVLERLAHWQAGEAMFSDHPWLGVGIGNYADAYALYALPHWYDPLGHAHDVYINFLAETGILGTGAFAVFWLGALALAWRTARHTTGYEMALAVGVLGTITYCTVHNIFDNLFVAHMQLQLALLLAALAAIRPAAGSSPDREVSW